MEDVLDVYTRAYDPSHPVVCMDESPKQLFGEVREPVPMKPGYVRKIDDEYERKGVAELLLAVEPLTGYLRCFSSSYQTRLGTLYQSVSR